MNECAKATGVPFNDVGWMWDECCICGKIVLGLAGQDQRLDRFLLDERDAAVAAGAVGRAHTSCLIRSGWGPRWNGVRARRFAADPRFRRLGDAETFTAFRDDRSGETHFFFTNGGHESVAVSALASAAPTAGGWMIPIAEVAAWNFRDYALVSADAWAILRREGRMPLIDLLRNLEVLPTLLFPEAIHGGEIRHLPEEDVDVVPTAGLTAEVFYRRFLPAALGPWLPGLR